MRLEELADAQSRGFYMVLPQITATGRCVGRREISTNAEDPSQKLI